MQYSGVASGQPQARGARAYGDFDLTSIRWGVKGRGWNRLPNAAIAPSPNLILGIEWVNSDVVFGQ